MSENEFVDYYELLQLSPNADTETIERIFRHFAKKFHPDNTQYADNERFRQIVEAHRTLADPEARAGYDVKYQDYWNRKWGLASEASDGLAFGDDQLTRERMLSVLYVQRRRNVRAPGLGENEVARLLHTPPELVEFHMWYLKAKGWVERLDTGHLAITALGVDQVEQSRLRLGPDHLLEAPVPASEKDEVKYLSDEDLLVIDD
jgi:curved DNA-binding protein CbpA